MWEKWKPPWTSVGSGDNVPVRKQIHYAGQDVHSTVVLVVRLADVNNVEPLFMCCRLILNDCLYKLPSAVDLGICKKVSKAMSNVWFPA